MHNKHFNYFKCRKLLGIHSLKEYQGRFHEDKESWSEHLRKCIQQIRILVEFKKLLPHIFLPDFIGFQYLLHLTRTKKFLFIWKLNIILNHGNLLLLMIKWHGCKLNFSNQLYYCKNNQRVIQSKQATTIYNWNRNWNVF